MRYPLLMFLLVTFCVSCSKDPQISKKQSDEFLKFFGSAGMDSSAHVLPVEGGYLMLASERTASGFQACIYKTDKNGNTLSRTVISDSLSFVASAMIAARDGGYWVCGSTTKLTDSTNKIYETFTVVAKVSAELMTLEISQYSRTNMVASAMAEDASGALYIAGSMTDESNNSKINCIKIAEKKMEWSELKGRSIVGVASGITFYNGSLYIVGSSDSFTEYGQEKNDILLLNVNTNGFVLDRMTYGGTGNDYGHSISAFNGHLYVSGSVFSDNDYSDGWLACFSGDLHNPDWVTTTHTRGYDELLSLSVTDAGIIASGYTTDETLRTKNIYITRFSLDGTLLKQYVSGGNDSEIARSVITAADGQPVVTGTMYADADAVLFMLKTKL